MPNTATLASGQVVAARYQLARPLAAGHATTWLARDTTTEREVVVRFRAGGESPEGNRISTVVRHAALLAPVASHEDDELAFDVFEYLPGGEIGRLRGRPWTLIARRLLTIAEALAVLHEAGWVHGDVKSANVLLDADGLPHLADWGSARRIGATQPAGASPYSTSPERLDGAPAAPADDVYAFGVLMYELVSGHPPFYPDITPERVRNEIPSALNGRPEPPAALRELVARCLAKQPLARPASMRDLHAELEHVLETAATVTPIPTVASPAAAWQPRPPADALPVQPQWRRSATTGPTPQALRNEGFRRGLLAGALVLALAAAGFTFFVLPGLVDSHKSVERPAAVAPNAQASPPPAPPPAVDFARLAEQKRLAEARREPLPGRLQALEARDIASWGGAPYAQARSELAAGDSAMTARDFAAALARFDAVARGLDQLEQRLPVVVAERRAAAQAAFDAGRAAEATDKYQALLKVAPGDAGARSGLARARVLDDVVRETASGSQRRAGGRRAGSAGCVSTCTAARSRRLRRHAPASRDWARANRAMRMPRRWHRHWLLWQARTTRPRGARSNARGASGRARPKSPRACARSSVLGETQNLTGTLERAAAAERAEQWSQALALYGEALKVEPALRAAQEGVERVGTPRDDRRRTAVVPRPARAPLQSGRARHCPQRARARGSGRGAGLATAAATGAAGAAVCARRRRRSRWRWPPTTQPTCRSTASVSWGSSTRGASN